MQLLAQHARQFIAAALAQVAAAPEGDLVMAAIVGAAGLKPTVAAVRSGQRMALANKEVEGGEDVTQQTACVNQSATSRKPVPNQVSFHLKANGIHSHINPDTRRKSFVDQSGNHLK